MTEVSVHNGRVRYALTAPWIIGSGLNPTVKVGEDSTIELWVAEWPDREGRVCYGFRVRQDGKTVAKGKDLRSGVGDKPNLDEMLRSLLSFAGYYAEHTDYVQRTGHDSDPLSADDVRLGEWYDEHENELFEYAYDEEEDE